jgi:tRNA (adenine57-N1/adenine58-N1)-methyltransferase
MKEIKKIIITQKGKKFYLDDLSKDFHTQYGFISKEDLKKKDGSLIKTNKGVTMKIITPGFKDTYDKIKRGAQIIMPKDIGRIISETGMNKESVVVDAGSGSGAAACFFAKIAKKVVTYDIRADFIKIVKKNKDMLGIKNLTIKNKDIYQKIDEKNVDIVVLDLPEPWKAIDSVSKSLKNSGFLAVYLPTILQVMSFVKKIKKDKNFIYLKTIETIEREWLVDQERVRPETKGLTHTAFLIFVRRV